MYAALQPTAIPCAPATLAARCQCSPSSNLLFFDSGKFQPRSAKSEPHCLHRSSSNARSLKAGRQSFSPFFETLILFKVHHPSGRGLPPKHFPGSASKPRLAAWTKALRSAAGAAVSNCALRMSQGNKFGAGAGGGRGVGLRKPRVHLRKAGGLFEMMWVESNPPCPLGNLLHRTWSPQTQFSQLCEAQNPHPINKLQFWGIQVFVGSTATGSFARGGP